MSYTLPSPICLYLNYLPIDTGTLARVCHTSPAPMAPCATSRRKIQGKTTHRQAHHYADRRDAAFMVALDHGWIDYFEDAARRLGNDEEDDDASFDAAVLMALGWRETRLDPKYLQKAGDNGHGYGLMQMDIRSFKSWIDAGSWHDARQCISKGAEILSGYRDEISEAHFHVLHVQDHTGKKYEVMGKEISGQDLLRVSIAAYNCGMWAYYHYSKGHDVDTGTTGKDYSRDVLANAPHFRKLLDAKHYWETMPFDPNIRLV